jgi:3-hydroxy-5-methyl-1-naphthoate 3-O-methyltransferase
MKSWRPFKRDDTGINKILEMVFGYQKSRTLLTACELDVFTLIGTDNKTASEVAILIDADIKATQRLLDALCSLDLLEKQIDKYTNSKISLRFLVKTKPEYMSIMDYHSNLWDSWGLLTKTVKKGKSSKVMKIQDYDKKTTEKFLDMVHWRSALLAPDIVKLIDLRNVNNVLDLGGGVGDYAIGFVNAKPDIKATVFSFPNCLPFAEDHLKYIKNREVADSIDIISGDIMEDDIGDGYDLIFVSFYFEYNNIWDNIKLSKKIWDALKTGGRIVVHDLLIDDKRTGPEFNALYALELLVTSEGGNVYTGSDIWLILKEAWFSKIQNIETDFGTSIVIGHKF